MCTYVLLGDVKPPVTRGAITIIIIIIMAAIPTPLLLAVLMVANDLGETIPNQLLLLLVGSSILCVSVDWIAVRKTGAQWLRVVSQAIRKKIWCKRLMACEVRRHPRFRPSCHRAGQTHSDAILSPIKYHEEQYVTPSHGGVRYSRTASNFR